MIEELILYDTAVCNLKCSYCFISKNEGLNIVDKELEESFKDSTYYINLLKTYLDSEQDLNNIKKIGIWGGEPLLHLDRVIPSLRSILLECPNITTIELSSNMAHDKVVYSIKCLMELLAEFDNRKFTFNHQISLDGPAEVTDLCRGKGVTEKLLDNLSNLLDNNYFCPVNVQVKPFAKATISSDTFSLFDTEEHIINYYKFFEDKFLNLFENRSQSITKLAPPLPNIACPGAYTREDGLVLADILKRLQQLEVKNQQEHIFKYYNKLVWLSSNKDLDKNNSYFYNYCFCNTGTGMLGLLPKNQACTCHRAFANYCTEYLNMFNNSSINTAILNEDNLINSKIAKFFTPSNKEEFKTHTRRMEQFKKFNNKSSIIVYGVTLIRLLASIGQVLPKYKDEDTAINAMQWLIKVLPLCAYDNVAENSSPMLFSTYIFKLYLNGALDIICNLED